MKKPDYTYKATVLSEHSDIVSLQRKISKAFYADYILHKDGVVAYTEFDVETAENMRSFLMSENSTLYQEAEKINHSFFERKKRLQNRIQVMTANSECVFLTLTFTDQVFETTTAETRRRYISRFLRSFGVPYVGNIDFGDNHTYIDEQGNTRQATAREHYHAVIAVPFVDRSLWKYGGLYAELVRKGEHQASLAMYVSKLANHAIKETARRNSLLYSR